MRFLLTFALLALVAAPASACDRCSQALVVQPVVTQAIVTQPVVTQQIVTQSVVQAEEVCGSATLVAQPIVLRQRFSRQRVVVGGHRRAIVRRAGVRRANIRVGGARAAVRVGRR